MYRRFSSLSAARCILIVRSWCGDTVSSAASRCHPLIRESGFAGLEILHCSGFSASMILCYYSAPHSSLAPLCPYPSTTQSALSQSSVAPFIRISPSDSLALYRLALYGEPAIAVLLPAVALARLAGEPIISALASLSAALNPSCASNPPADGFGGRCKRCLCPPTDGEAAMSLGVLVATSAGLLPDIVGPPVLGCCET